MPIGTELHDLIVERDAEELSFQLTPKAHEDGTGRIGVELRENRRDVGAREAAYLSVLDTFWKFLSNLIYSTGS